MHEQKAGNWEIRPPGPNAHPPNSTSKLREQTRTGAWGVPNRRLSSLSTIDGFYDTKEKQGLRKTGSGDKPHHLSVWRAHTSEMPRILSEKQGGEERPTRSRGCQSPLHQIRLKTQGYDGKSTPYKANTRGFEQPYRGIQIDQAPEESEVSPLRMAADSNESVPGHRQGRTNQVLRTSGVPQIQEKAEEPSSKKGCGPSLQKVVFCARISSPPDPMSSGPVTLNIPPARARPAGSSRR